MPPPTRRVEGNRRMVQCEDSRGNKWRHGPYATEREAQVTAQRIMDSMSGVSAYVYDEKRDDDKAFT